MWLASLWLIEFITKVTTKMNETQGNRADSIPTTSISMQWGKNVRIIYLKTKQMSSMLKRRFFVFQGTIARRIKIWFLFLDTVLNYCQIGNKKIKYTWKFWQCFERHNELIFTAFIADMFCHRDIMSLNLMLFIKKPLSFTSSMVSRL